jgi:hypothetical protein
VATRKQRKRTQKERRHEYENVWIHADGTESEEPPEDYVEPAPRDPKSKPQQKRTQQRSSRPTRTPLPPSWRRAAKRAGLLGAVIFVLFALLNSKNGSSGYISALLLAILYTALFVPFTYYVDRFAYRRWQRREAEQPRKR